MAKPILVKPGSKVRLRDIDANGVGHHHKPAAEAHAARDQQRISDLQARLYAENTRALLVVLQGMDTSGKDGTVKRVFGEVSPVGMQVSAFVAPSEEERDHDFLWRVNNRIPRRGNIGVFNRSHYEDVLVVRVHRLAHESVWRPRFDQINRYEALVSDLGTRVLKIFLHIDRDEQRKRLEARLHDPDKGWKFAASDLEDRKKWDDFQDAYEDVLEKCSTKVAPWYVVPANKKWYRDMVISKLVADTLDAMDPQPPKLTLDLSKVRIPR